MTTKTKWSGQVKKNYGLAILVSILYCWRCSHHFKETQWSVNFDKEKFIEFKINSLHSLSYVISRAQVNLHISF